MVNHGNDSDYRLLCFIFVLNGVSQKKNSQAKYI